MEAEVILWILLFLLAHPFLVSFASGILGEEATLLLAIVSSRLAIPLWIIMASSFLGLIMADLGWFYIGKLQFTKRMYFRHFSLRKEGQIGIAIRNIAQKNEFLSLFVSKFIFAIRAIKIFSMSIKNCQLKKFLLYDVGAVFLWSIIVVPAGWLAGRGVIALLGTVKGAERVLDYIVIFIVVIYVLEKLIRKFVVYEYAK